MEAKKFDIIIAGAGPTGLMLACQLSRLGIDFLILDKKAGPTKESRALVVQARSMEIYQQMGLSEKVESEGRPSAGISFYKKGRQLLTLSLENMGKGLSPFPYVMIFEQSHNERLLYEDLQSIGKQVSWNTEITDIREEEGRYSLVTRSTAEVSGSADPVGEVSCTYLIACDGSKSKVRDFAGVAFTGGSYENVFYVADTHIGGSALSRDKLSLFFTRASITLLFPLPGDERFRVLGILPKEYYHQEHIGFEDISGAVHENLQLPVEFYETQWYSTYKLYHKKVDRFNKGNIFFVGDAAHVHSPAGGQGMNTGLQDAYNLAWKLALVLKNQAARSLLDTYHEERNPVAERLLKTTDRLFSIMTGSNRISGFIKMHIVPRLLPLINKRKGFRTKWFSEVSQIKINYTGSSLSAGTAGQIKAGQRFPWFTVEHKGQQSSIFRLIRKQHVTPFLVLIYNLPDKEWTALDKQLFTVVSIDVNGFNDQALKGVGLPGAFVAVLRPDTYIGYLTEKGFEQAFLRLMKEGYSIN